ncbi:hypothetical protein BH23VER1_BH23VER1_20550 [soil metagenome]
MNPHLPLPVLLLSLLLLCCAPPAAADDFLSEFQRLQAEGDRQAFEHFLDRSGTTHDDNPDYYATAGNYWWQLSRSLGARSGIGGGFDPGLNQPGGADEMAAAAGQAQETLAKKAVSILEMGASRFPRRADLGLGLAHVQQETGRGEECVATLLALLGEAKRNPSDLRWKEGAQLPGPVGSFLPEALQTFTAAFYRGSSPQDKALCAKLGRAIVATFPQHPYAYTILAALASSQGDHAGALKLLESAAKSAPGDGLTLLNLAGAYRKSGQPTKAAATYRKILALDVEAAIKRQAQAGLKALE